MTIPGFNSPAMRALVLLLAALLNAPAATAKIPFGSIKRFGVVAVVADKFTRSVIGITVFGNKTDEINVASWGIDAAYTDQLGKVVADLLSAQYVAAPYPYDDFSKINQTTLRGAPNWSSIESTVKTYCSANGLDTLLVIGKDRGMIPNTTIARVPMGIQGGRSGGHLELSIRVNVYNCATGRMQESELMRFTPPGQFLFWEVPQVEVSPDLMTQPLSEMDDKTREDIKAKLLILPGPYWDLTLRRMVRTP